MHYLHYWVNYVKTGRLYFDELKDSAREDLHIVDNLLYT